MRFYNNGKNLQPVDQQSIHGRVAYPVNQILHTLEWTQNRRCWNFRYTFIRIHLLYIIVVLTFENWKMITRKIQTRNLVYLLNFIFTSMPVVSLWSKSIASAIFCCWFLTYSASLFYHQVNKLNLVEIKTGKKLRFGKKRRRNMLLVERKQE